MRKRLLYLTNDQLAAYEWERGGLTIGHALRLSSGQAFPNDEAGWEAFSGHLAASPNIPVYLLADLVEEDFQRDSLPHVLGRARRKLVQRRLGQLYRDTPYRQAAPQGRETEGRKDDRMLFSALTNAGLLKPWLDAILEQRAPLAGIYSPPLLSAALVRKFGIASGHLLLTTHQSGGLRQSYFQGKYLKFSRLTPLTDHSPATVAETVARETAKTRQFLSSTRQLPRNEAMEVVILDQDPSLPQIEAACPDTDTLAYRFLDLEDTARQLGLQGLPPGLYGEALFLFLLGRSAPASHYAPPEQTRFFRLWQARIALYGLSFSALAGGLLWAGSNALDALEYHRQGLQMASETRTAQAQHQAIVGSLPPTAASPQDMKAAVQIEQMISRNASTPAELFGIVSRALDALPQIRIDQLQWQVAETPGTTAEPANPPAARPQPAAEPALSLSKGGEEAPPAALIGIPQKPYQILLIEGEVSPFPSTGPGQAKNDYRTALESVRQFAAELGKNRQLQVEITRLPLDTRPAVRLEGKAGNGDASAPAHFALKLVWKPVPSLSKWPEG